MRNVSFLKRRIAVVVAILLAAAMTVFLAACQPKASDYPFNDSDVIEKNYDYVVEIIGTKTQTVYLYSGETLEADKPTNIPKKSCEVFSGWYADGANTEYDWSAPVTSDLIIRARFSPVPGLSVGNGIAFPQPNGGVLTGSNDTLFTLGDFDTVESGIFQIDVTPVNEGNDCGVFFGANPPESGAWWESGVNYFIALVNKDGVLLLAKVNPWTVIAETTIAEYDHTKTYTVKIAYNRGMVDVYIDGAKLISSEIGGLRGTAFGGRAQVAGTVFGAVSIPDDELPAPPEHYVGAFTTRSGGWSTAGGADTAVVSDTANALAVLTDKSADRVSITMSGHTSGDNGIVFGLTDNYDTKYWEANAESYYFLFITNNGLVRLARIAPTWNEPFVSQGTNVNMPASNGTYRLEVVMDRSKKSIDCYVNGVKAFTVTDENTLGGASFGVRASGVGVRFDYNDISDKKYVSIDNGTETTFGFVDVGTVIAQPEAPQKHGYEFQGWFANGSDTTFDFTSAITEDTSITARLTLSSDAKYDVKRGDIVESDGGFKTTKDQTLFVLRDTEFTRGSFEATFKPTTANDCGIIFGANVTPSATWENFDYYMVLLNSTGILFLSKSPWTVVASYTVSGYSASNTYTVKVVYDSGYARVYCNGALAVTAYLGELAGTSVGMRAAAANTEFIGDAVVDAEAELEMGAASTDVGTFVKRHGDGVTETDGTYTSASIDAIATSDKVLDRGGSVSVKINVNGNIGCNGVIFGLASAVTGEFWEEQTYYFFFIDEGGSVRLARTNGWNEAPFTRLNSERVDLSGEHTMTVSWDGNGVTCFLDGRLYFASDGFKLGGGAFGVRAQNAGVTFKDFSVVAY